MFCLGLVAATVILLRRSARHGSRRPGDQSPLVHVARNNELSVTGARDAAAERLREEVRMHETARELAARLDSKIAVLEYLTGTAQQQIERLAALIDRAERIAPKTFDGQAHDGQARSGQAIDQNAVRNQ
ncbi:MAG: hypothetical protein A2W31_06305 [Planctomycetes bacterium RBG_16_64_10]|nr:MAG: hypothetical protein A2W31_06305 [Planctomycetes bacterium RBG_16_64_10]